MNSQTIVRITLRLTTRRFVQVQDGSHGVPIVVVAVGAARRSDVYVARHLSVGKRLDPWSTDPLNQSGRFFIQSLNLREILANLVAVYDGITQRSPRRRSRNDGQLDALTKPIDCIQEVVQTFVADEFVFYQ